MSEGRHGSDAQPPSPAAFTFGPYTIPPSTVFAATALSFAFVNLRPAVPGHVLVATRASRALFRDLLPAEVADVWQLAQRVGVAVTRSFDAKGLQFAVQDGAASGQTVPHLHIHVVPRRPGDFGRNDDVYEAVEQSEGGLTRLDPARQRDVQAARADRSAEDMAAEAHTLREAMRAAA